MYVEMVDPQRALLEEIADKRMTRDDVALTYAFALRQSNEINWAQVNRAIMDRWSLSALKYVKESAWRILETGHTKDGAISVAPPRKEHD